MEKYQELRRQYPHFCYIGYTVEETASECRVTYQFEIEKLARFAPEWRFPKRMEDGQEAVRWSDDPLMREMLFSLGMVELVSYWKLTCSPQVRILCGSLNEEQILWWKDLYFNGLGEFFYVNQIGEADPCDFMEIICEAQTAGGLAAPPAPVSDEVWRAETDALTGAEKGVLVPVGGGKDSAVTLELLRKAGVPLYAYIINPRGATVHTTAAAGLDPAHVIAVRRTLDGNMLELNRQGYLNGHTPFSALVAFSSVIAARLYGLSYIALSNEASANESTVQGSTVNHQYSKSMKFEEDFHWYQRNYLPGSAFYFSMLRPLSEFQIARYFAGQKQYHRIFRSCNAGSKTDSWCGRCPKCLFVYLILSPFLSRQELREIFGRDLLEDGELKPILEQLTGIQEEKPFECVGSRDEINTAAVLTIDQIERAGEPLPVLLSCYKASGLYRRYKPLGDRYSHYFDEENLVPKPWKEIVRKNCASW